MTAIKRSAYYRDIFPLAVLRIAFGAVLFLSTLRFIVKGWVRDFYITPVFHFPFYPFGWLVPLGGVGMYVVYGVMAVAALMICLGFFYRVGAVVFFVCFSYAELLDKTYYLNHYYFVTIFSFLLIWVPANRYWSLDVLRRPALKTRVVPAWTVLLFRYQLCIVYFFAGLSKLTADWLFYAMPLRIWLPAKASIPLIGPLLRYEATAFFFSWAGALFDLSIPFLLMYRRTRRVGYGLVVCFHLLTMVLFQIGMFPYLMMSATLVFFSWGGVEVSVGEESLRHVRRWMPFLLRVYFFVQLLVPCRFLLYPGNLNWTEEGYRFSWRVMLMEKGGAAFFYVRDPVTGRRFEVNNRQFLTSYQERMMETQPDMILQYAHILAAQYRLRGIRQPEVRVESYVTLNGRGSRLYIDSTVNLADKQFSLWGHQSWILPLAK